MRAPVMAAGGIVLRRERAPLIAVVRLRKRNEWVLPKGKLDDGETPRAAAEREVLEETGHDVSVHEFLGTLVYESGGRSKVVHYWRMEARGGQAYELMHDVTAVDWLPLGVAVERLSRSHERAFLAHVGPLALEAAVAAKSARRPKPKRPGPEKKRGGRRIVAAPPSLPTSVPPRAELTTPVIVEEERPLAASDAVIEVETSVDIAEAEMETPLAEAGSAAPAEEVEAHDYDVVTTERGPRRNLVQKVRDWLRRAA